MIQAYNHFLTEYSSSLSKHSSAHKQKELKDVYSRIVSMNRNTAYYKLDLSDDKQFFSLSLKDSALTLSDKLKGLSTLFDEPGTMTDIKSSDEASVSVRLLPSSGQTASFEPLSVRVNTIAMPQVNRGEFVSSDAPGPSPASYRFRIRVSEDEYEFSYKINNASTNRDIMGKLSDFINKSNISIHAEVEDTPKTGLSRLVLSSTQTGVPEGEALRFEILDTAVSAAGSTGLVDWFGLDHVSEQPVNAQFSINGTEHESMQNELILDQRISLTLHGPSVNDVSISPKSSGEQTIRELQNFLESYNELVALSKNGLSGNRRSARLQSELNHILSSDLEALYASGIRRNEDSTLSLDSDVLQQSGSVERLKQLFEEPDGLLAQLTHKMQDIALDPVKYIDKVIVTYPNTSRTGFHNPYVTSIYSGMMFNSYC